MDAAHLRSLRDGSSSDIGKCVSQLEHLDPEDGNVVLAMRTFALQRSVAVVHRILRRSLQH